MACHIAEEIIWSPHENLPFEGLPYNIKDGIMCNPGSPDYRVFSCKECISTPIDVTKCDEVFTLEDLENNPNSFIMAIASPIPKPIECANLAYYFPYVKKEEMNCGVADGDGDANDAGGAIDVVVTE